MRTGGFLRELLVEPVVGEPAADPVVGISEPTGPPGGPTDDSGPPETAERWRSARRAEPPAE